MSDENKAEKESIVLGGDRERYEELEWKLNHILRITQCIAITTAAIGEAVHTMVAGDDKLKQAVATLKKKTDHLQETIKSLPNT